MAKGTSSPSGLSPGRVGGFPRARINSANSVDSTDSVTMAALDATVDKARSVQFDDEATRGHGDGRDDEGEDEEEKAEFGDVKTTAELLGKVEELSPQFSQIGRPLPVRCNLAAELEDGADDDDDDEQGVAPGDRPPLIPRATRNADTPSANRVLARLGEEMRSEREWMIMFAPVAMTQAKGTVLGPVLTQPVISTNINQLVGDTVPLLKAMGFRCNGRANSLILGDWSLSRAGAQLLKWKRRLRLAFGMERHVGSRQTIARRTAEFPRRESDPSRVPLPKTPETKKGKKEVFRATKGTPYYEDSHMQTPKTLKGRNARYTEFYDTADEAELGGDNSDDGRDYRDSADDSANVIRRLSLDDAERDRGYYIEVRSHASLDKIAEFEGKRYRSDDSLQWLKRFIYEMKGTRMSQASWREPFSLCLGRAAKSWYRQLSKKTQRKWNLLSEAFLDYYCSQLTTVGVTGVITADMVGDLDETMDVIAELLWQLPLTTKRRTEWSASRVDDCVSITMTMMRVTTAERPTPTRKEGQITITLMLCSPMRRAVGGMLPRTLLGPKRILPELSAAPLDLKGARLSSGTRLINQPKPLAEPTGSLTAEIIMDVGATHANDSNMDRVQLVAARSTQCTSVASAANFISKRLPGPLQAEQFKLGGPPTLTGLDEAGLPQSAEPVAEAKYIFAYVGKAGRPERVWKDGNGGSKLDGIDGELVYSKEESRAMIRNAGAARLRKGAMGMAKTMKLLPGERLGWWSEQKFDRRVRMRALVMGAVNDQRSKILLDSEANISAINATFARKLRLKRQARRDVRIGVPGIGKGNVGTSTRAWVKISLGWEVSYEFEVWVMDHHAGVDLILGTDFLIPAGIRLDLYNSLAKLPDEVVVPPIKSLKLG
ncbi:unnamed protein product [Phytophthora fragariaefolia]|uniref:Unnamed protein product n=1 Tax=Phytophthora fragariaefolia TaxID=1490495 RepID=A0A9W6Y5W3_9STRA|nr:unnamed protein product [Phytophthora fragariaefolia]